MNEEVDDNRDGKKKFKGKPKGKKTKKYTIQMRHGASRKVLALGKECGSEEELYNELDEITDLVSQFPNTLSYCEGDERLHIIEHIILRPKINEEIGEENIEDNLLLINHPYGQEHEGLADSYSFRTTVLLPDWIDKFSIESEGELNEFREYAERTVRSEIPAHIVSDIYWVNNEAMNDFEFVYENWLALKAILEPIDKNQRDDYRIRLSTALNAVINQLTEIRG